MSVIPSAQAKALSDGPVGLYVHVPFCARTCDYCAFYQIAPRAEDIRGYLSGIESEGMLVTWPEKIDTVFWGGGTPGLLAADDLRRLGRLCRAHCGTVPPREWTVEMAPVTVTEARLAALREFGVNRISIGVQSFQEGLLDALGRQHTKDQVYRAYDRVRAAGFDNVNLDLMFALPGQDTEGWMRDLDEAIALGPEHLSTYCLTLEEDTKLWLQLSRGKAPRDPSREADFYLATWRRLSEAGYAQYEVSNFSRSGRESIHNMNTWRMERWIGLGPSAASQYAGWRASNVADLSAWRESLDRGERATVEKRELSPALLAEDSLIFGLRMNRGVDLARFPTRFPGVSWERLENLWERLESDSKIERKGTWVRLTDSGRLVADAVGAEIVGTFAE